MKYQALLLVIAVLFSVLMLRVLGDRPVPTISNETAPYASAPIPYSGKSIPPPASWLQTIQTEKLALTQKPRVSASTTRLSAPVAIETPAVSQNSSSASVCDLTASLYLARDITADHTLLSKNEQQRWPIASVSKLMTALVAYEHMDAKEIISVSQSAHDHAQGYASLEVGASYSVNDLVRAALTISSNDATFALAEAFGYDAFIAQMNKQAKDIGMHNTSFFDPSGLSYLNQSTVSDISLLLRYLYTSAPELLATTRKQTVSLYDSAHHRTVTLSNIDYFAGTDGFIGGKTGFITESGGNLVTLFNYHNHILAIEVFDSADRFKDVQKLFTCAKNAINNP
ncbi:MAG: serine hydrolase [Patescibacteria group bacterium]|nr:serine hydrolase [Patescibacteria group bacterium]